MMGSRSFSGRVLRAASLLALVLTFGLARAQTDIIPSSVDARLVHGASTDQLLVQLKIHSTDDFGGILSALTITIHYDAASGSSLGAGTSFCNAWSAFTPTPVVLNGGIAYRTYNGFGVNRLEDPVFDGGCATSLVPEQWFTITTIPVAGSGCTTFSLDNDAFTQQSNRNFYVSMGGHDVTGQVVGGSLNGGACTPDCLGTIGGTALPGTPCDDNDPNTSDDTWTADCVCIGTGCVAPAITGTSNNGPICSDNDLNLSVSATGSGPLTYAWTGPGTFSPDAASASVTVGGAASGTYQVSVTNSCGNAAASIPVVVQQAPVAAISYDGSPYCTTGGTVNVTRTGTPGGTYSSAPNGLSISSGTGAITLSASSAGTYTVTYSIAASGGCAAFSTTAGVVINPAPSATIAYSGSPYCNSGGTVNVTRTGSSGGTYSATPAGLSISGSTGAINLGASTAGSYTVTYSIATSGGCAAFSTTANVVINSGPSATISYSGSPYCTNGGTASVTRTGSSGGAYTAAPGGLSINGNTGAINLGNSTAGTYTVTYGIATSGGCMAFTTSATVVINSATTWYADADNDGVGDDASTVQACTQPAGYVAVGGDLCPDDPAKVSPGTCGCGIPDTDTDNDGTADCVDGCPTDPNKVAPGICGCGIPDTDTDLDGSADCIDNCPSLEGVIGDPCDDGDNTTTNDVITPDCVCEGTITVGIAESEGTPEATMNVYPNPNATGTVFLDLDGLSMGEGPALIEIHDVFGRLVHQASALQVGGKVHLAMDLSTGVGRGLYLVRVTTNGHRYLRQLVMQ